MTTSAREDCARNQRSVEVMVKVTRVHVLMDLQAMIVGMLSEFRAVTSHAAVSAIIQLSCDIISFL